MQNGYIYTSTDDGVNWTELTASGSRVWQDIAVSSDGITMAAADFGGYIHTTSNSGTTWKTRTGSGQHAWYSIVLSIDGIKTKFAAGGGSSYIYTAEY